MSDAFSITDHDRLPAGQRILIWGAGTIGGVAGAYLHRAGYDVTLVDSNVAHVAAICDGGLALEGPVDTFTARVAVLLPHEVTAEWPCVLLAVKAQHTDTACAMLAPHLRADGCVVSLQNGLCVERVSAALGPGRTLAAFVNYAGDWLSPGRLRFGARGAVMVGELDGADTPRLRALVRALRDFEPRTEATSRINAYLWGKLCFTVLLVAQALGQAAIVDCLARPGLLPLWRCLTGEVVAVANAHGVEPLGFDGVDPAAFASAASIDAARRSIRDIVEYNRGGAKTHSGYWRDLAIHKRKTEAPAQLQPVIDIGRRHGIDCVALRALLVRVREVEDGARVQSDALLAELAEEVAPSFESGA